MKFIFVILCLLAAVAISQKTPIWPPRFQQEIYEFWATPKVGTISRIWYDTGVNSQRIDRNNGRYDPFCGSVVDGNTPCITYIINGKRTLFFPAIRTCCVCCSKPECGMTPRDWLSSTKFNGTDELDGKFFYKFVDNQRDIQYWTTADDKQIPRKLALNKEHFADFIVAEYSEK